MSQFTVLAYLDHNILDSMLKGDPAGIADLLRDENISPVFSSENLAEIHRSKGREIEFLQLLDADGGMNFAHPIVVAQINHVVLAGNFSFSV